MGYVKFMIKQSYICLTQNYTMQKVKDKQLCAKSWNTFLQNFSQLQIYCIESVIDAEFDSIQVLRTDREQNTSG